jgi:hypothetical protein
MSQPKSKPQRRGAENAEGAEKSIWNKGFHLRDRNRVVPCFEVETFTQQNKVSGAPQIDEGNIEHISILCCCNDPLGFLCALCVLCASALGF